MQSTTFTWDGQRDPQTSKTTTCLHVHSMLLLQKGNISLMGSIL